MGRRATNSAPYPQSVASALPSLRSAQPAVPATSVTLFGRFGTTSGADNDSIVWAAPRLCWHSSRGLAAPVTLGGPSVSATHSASATARPSRHAVGQVPQAMAALPFPGLPFLGPTAVSASNITLFLGLDELSTGGVVASMGAGSIVPSITLTERPACASSDVSRYSIMAASCSSLRFLSGLLCSTLCSRGTNSARILR
jgi:hypothetical protein